MYDLSDMFSHIHKLLIFFLLLLVQDLSGISEHLVDHLSSHAFFDFMVFLLLPANDLYLLWELIMDKQVHRFLMFLRCIDLADLA